MNDICLFFVVLIVMNGCMNCFDQLPQDALYVNISALTRNHGGQ